MQEATFLSKVSDATVIAAVIAGIFLVWQTWYQRIKASRTIRDALFAELGHIEDHYSITAAELRSAAESQPLSRRLKWALFGRVMAAESLKEYATLGAVEMERLLQLAFVIRNTDSLIEELLKSNQAINPDNIAYLAHRMDLARLIARKLMEALAAKESRFEPLLRLARVVQSTL